MNLERLPTRNADGAVHVVVESPRGSTVKLKFDPELGAFTVARALVLGLAYPFDWGFIPGTRADDGDALDAMLLWDASTSPGVVVPGRPFAVIQLEQDAGGGGKVRNDRILAVPVASMRGAPLRGPEDLAERVRRELENFFVAATRYTSKDPRVLGWGGAAQAEALIEASRR